MRNDSSYQFQATVVPINQILWALRDKLDRYRSATCHLTPETELDAPGPRHPRLSIKHGFEVHHILLRSGILSS